MKKSTSYKSMLRDRTPSTIDAALKWCKAKECWINHVYNHFINIYVDKEQRYEATRIVLGISSKHRNFNFNKTIDWPNLSDEEAESWKSVESWINWFSVYAQRIKNIYDERKYIYSREEIEDFIVNKVLNTESTNDKNATYKLVKFIIDSL